MVQRYVALAETNHRCQIDLLLQLEQLVAVVEIFLAFVDVKVERLDRLECGDEIRIVDMRLLGGFEQLLHECSGKNHPQPGAILIAIIAILIISVLAERADIEASAALA